MDADDKMFYFNLKDIDSINMNDNINNHLKTNQCLV